MKLSAGIDFGTTNTAMGYSNSEGDVSMAHIGENGKSTTERTAIFYDFSDVRNPIIGEEGRQLYIEGEEGKLITSPKSFLKAQELPKVGVLRQRYDLMEVISHILIEFKSRLEKEAGESIDSILVGRPVKFHDSKPELDRIAQERLEKAFKLAGFNNVEFQYEPIAAYNSFLHSNPGKINIGDTTLVVDLGGGTSDFSVVLQGDKESEVIGNGGVYIGGDNVDQRLIFSHYANHFGKGAQYKSMEGSELNVPISIFGGLADKTKLLFFKQDYGRIIQGILPILISEQGKIEFGRLKEILEDLGLGNYLHSIVEKSKIELTESASSSSSFDLFRKPFSVDLNQKELEEIIKDEVNTICLGIKGILEEAGINAEGLNNVIMNGGTSYIPVIQQAVEGLVGKGKILQTDDLSAVGRGLTLESFNIFK